MDCAVVGCATYESLCDTSLPGDVLDVGLAALCAPPRVAGSIDIPKLGPPPEIPAVLRLLSTDQETETALGDWLRHSRAARIKIELGDAVTALPSRFLQSWSAVKLTSLELSGKVKQVGCGFLHRCSSLTSVTLPDGLQRVGDNFLFGCSNLSTVRCPPHLSAHIPSSVTHVLCTAGVDE